MGGAAQRGEVSAAGAISNLALREPSAAQPQLDQVFSILVTEFTEAEPEVTEAKFADEYIEMLHVLRLDLDALSVEGLEPSHFEDCTQENNILNLCGREFEEEDTEQLSILVPLGSAL